MEEYIEAYEPDKVMIGAHGSSVIPTLAFNPIQPYRHRAKQKFLFCNTTHYNEFKKNNPGLVQPPESIECRKAKSANMKDRIAKGLFTPKNNTYTNWKFSLLDQKYRSRWEMAFHAANPTFEYETIRIPYVDLHGSNRIYIVDFYDKTLNVCYEIKPSSDVSSHLNLVKMNSLKIYCDTRGWSFKIITEFEILEILNYLVTDEPHLCNLKINLSHQLKRLK
jgi:hypothetical protein